MDSPTALAASLQDAEERRNVTANTMARCLAFGMPISDTLIAEWSELDDLVSANRTALRQSIAKALA